MPNRNGGGVIATKEHVPRDSIEAPTGKLGPGIRDITQGIKGWRVWLLLTWYDLRSQYRRTYLGPWWITVQQVIFVVGLSLLFGVLFKQDLTTFIPYVTIGFIAFTWMTGMIQGAAGCIVANGSAIRTAPGPLSIYPLRNLATNTIQFAHDAVVIVAVIIVFQVKVSAALALVPVGLALIVVNGLAIGLWLGPVVVRYRDVGEIVNSVTRVLFFFTPIFWVTSDLSRNQLAALSGWNPLAYLLQFLRAPLLGEWPSWLTVWACLGITLVNLLAGIVHFSRTRYRLAYWL